MSDSDVELDGESYSPLCWILDHNWKFTDLPPASLLSNFILFSCFDFILNLTHASLLN